MMTIDPRGIYVVCSHTILLNHILPGHPVMRGLEDIMLNTVTDPDIIYGSDEYPERDVYFKLIDSSKNKYMKVIVKTSGKNGEIITAFPQRGIRGNINKENPRYVKT